MFSHAGVVEQAPQFLNGRRRGIIGDVVLSLSERVRASLNQRRNCLTRKPVLSKMEVGRFKQQRIRIFCFRERVSMLPLCFSKPVVSNFGREFCFLSRAYRRTSAASPLLPANQLFQFTREGGPRARAVNFGERVSLNERRSSCRPTFQLSLRKCMFVFPRARR